ncbi:uncharacterized protein LOC112027388 [Quercus suber]|uniref:DUF1995 domain-containing protein n=1 Tax=Quercus suber TaxID=58331 RepID=A0AAW0L388_QUESU|nr:uncharacterized protein LOC112027388 [Quercus suber]POF06301.1 hypothetical protein CFP56_51583 [Quercus suber]
MASNLLKLHLQTIKTAKPSTPFPHSKIPLTFLPFHSHQNLIHQHHSHVSFFPPTLHHKPISIYSSLSSSYPPTSKEEAILQAKTCLSTTLEKPLNNPKLVGKLKKLKQPRFRIEIPVIDDSSASLSQLAFNVFQDLPIKRKGSPVKLLILWPNLTLTEAAIKAFQTQNSANQIENIDISSVTDADTNILNSADVAVFLAPEALQLAFIKTVTESFYPKPVVIFNPKWVFEEESNFSELSGFVGSFEVVYSFMGLEVRGVLSKRKGVVFKCVRDGVVSGEKWTILVEEEGELKVIMRFKTRPSIGEVENVLYNLMAINSPITKSAKFFRGLVSNVTGKK